MTRKFVLLGLSLLCALTATCALVYDGLFDEYRGAGGGPDGGREAGLANSSTAAPSSAASTAASSSSSTSTGAGGDAGPCGPWTDDALCHQGPPAFTLSCNTKANCAEFANCQQYDCLEGTCCFWIVNGGPATCGPSTCTKASDCGPDGGAPSPCVALSCMNGQCVGTFTGSCCSP